MKFRSGQVKGFQVFNFIQVMSANTTPVSGDYLKVRPFTLIHLSIQSVTRKHCERPQLGMFGTQISGKGIKYYDIGQLNHY